MDILKLYFNELKPFNATREENLLLISKWKEGDVRAYDRLVRNFLPLVVKISKKYGSSSSSLEDLIASGNEYLLKGLAKFEESKGELAPYLVRWIEAGIIRFLKGENGVVHIPENVVNMGTRNEYFYLDISTGDEDKDTWVDRIEDVVEEIEEDYRVHAFLNSLSDRDRIIVKMHFGIDHEKSFESKEIAVTVGLTKERVNQILAKYRK